MQELLVELAPSRRSVCRECGKHIALFERRVRITGAYKFGFVYCGSCIEKFFQNWQAFNQTEAEVKDVIRKLNVEVENADP